MLFFSFFKTLVGKEVAVEMKNGIVLTGTLVSVDQYLNVKLSSVNVVDTDRYPQLVRSLTSTSLSQKSEISFDKILELINRRPQ
jgi:small nuclear ribonucleoprotein (snRNP)-like protein